jgi:hypothetical protein
MLEDFAPATVGDELRILPRSSSLWAPRVLWPNSVVQVLLSLIIATMF